MNVGNFLTPKSAKIPVLQVKGLSGRSQPQGQQHRVLLAALEISKVDLSHLSCWMCSHCFESSFEKNLIVKGTYTNARVYSDLTVLYFCADFFIRGEYSQMEKRLESVPHQP